MHTIIDNEPFDLLIRSKRGTFRDIIENLHSIRFENATVFRALQGRSAKTRSGYPKTDHLRWVASQGLIY